MSKRTADKSSFIEETIPTNEDVRGWIHMGAMNFNNDKTSKQQQPTPWSCWWFRAPKKQKRSNGKRVNKGKSKEQGWMTCNCCSQFSLPYLIEMAKQGYLKEFILPRSAVTFIYCNLRRDPTWIENSNKK